jgi:hypothetical protein
MVHSEGSGRGFMLENRLPLLQRDSPADSLQFPYRVFN